jgi:two-component system, NarL family, nitrate/nitrite response regulator NarL
MAEEVVRLRSETLVADEAGAASAGDFGGAGPDGEHGGLTAAVVAGNEVLRRGVEGLLRAVPELGTVRECGRPDQWGSLLSHTRVDVVVVDASNVSWLDGHHETLAEMGTVVLVVVDDSSIDGLSAHPSHPIGGFLWRPSLTLEGLREALRTQRRGSATMPPELAQALWARASSAGIRGRSGRPNLTHREREALALLVMGLSNKQIARRLSISSHGAKRLVASIMLKLDAPNRTLAAVKAIRVGIVDCD